MRNKHWLRFSLASLMVSVAASSAALIACSDDDDDNKINPTPTQDSGTPETSTPTDGGDATTPKPVPAKLQLVNAATSLGPQANLNPAGEVPTAAELKLLALKGALRVCYGASTAGAEDANKPERVAPLPALPDTVADPAVAPAAVPIGTGGPIPATPGLSYEPLTIVPYIMSAASLAKAGVPGRKKTEAVAAGQSCPELLAAARPGGALVEGTDYWKLDPIAAGTLKNEKSYILVLTGCAANATDGAKCGDGFTPSEAPGKGNLKVNVFEVDAKTAVAADKIGTQFIHASPAGAEYLKTAGPDDTALPVKPGFTTAADGTTGFQSITGGMEVTTLSPVAALVQTAGVTPASAFFTAVQGVAPITQTLVTPVENGLPPIQVLSWGGQTPPAGQEYGNGKAFTFIALGDPTWDIDTENPQNPQNLRGFHYLALPNNPATVNFSGGAQQ